MIAFEHLFTYTTPQNFTRFKGIIKAFSGMCVRLTSVTFPVIWSNVIDFSDLAILCAGHVFPYKLVMAIAAKCQRAKILPIRARC